MKKITDTEFSVTNINVDEDRSTVDMEGDVGPYGKAYVSIILVPSHGSRETGTYHGYVRTITGDGEMIAGSLQGIWKRAGTLVHLKGLDDASNGDQNYSEVTLDLINKTAAGAVYEAWS